MPIHPASDQLARDAAAFIRERLLHNTTAFGLGLVLGTGWGDVLSFDDNQIPFREIPGFEGLGELEGHARCVARGMIGGKLVVALRGRVHMYEGHPDKVRLQIAMLHHLGVRKLVLTNAVGALRPDIKPGRVIALDGFASSASAVMPVYTGEFTDAEEPLKRDLRIKILEAARRANLPGEAGGLSWWRGPHFEGRKYDKPRLARDGTSVVGMSILPECHIASLYGMDVAAVSYVTNDMVQPMLHEEHVARAKKDAPKLGALLENLFRSL